MASSPAITSSPSPAFTAMEPFTLPPSAAGTNITTILHDEDPKGAMIQATALEVDGLMQTFMETLDSHNDEIEVLNGTIKSQAKTIDQLQTDNLKLRSMLQEIFLLHKRELEEITDYKSSLSQQVNADAEVIAGRCKKIDDRQKPQQLCQEAYVLGPYVRNDGGRYVRIPALITEFNTVLAQIPKEYHPRATQKGVKPLEIFAIESNADTEAIGDKISHIKSEVKKFDEITTGMSQNFEKLKEKFDETSSL